MINDLESFKQHCIANKLLDDIPYDNKTYSNLSNIPIGEFNSVELNILKLLDWNIIVTNDEIIKLKLYIEKTVKTIKL